jgi:hypothetical protein
MCQNDEYLTKHKEKSSESVLYNISDELDLARESEDSTVSSEIFRVRKRSKAKSLHVQARSAKVIINAILRSIHTGHAVA